MSDTPKSGQVWRYSYLWAWQHERGEIKGRKSRPTALAITVLQADGLTAMYLLPVTSTKPDADRQAIEVPETEKHRVGLTDRPRSWVIVDEYNMDVAEKSYYLEPDALMGTFSLPFLRQVQRMFREVVRARGASGIKRSDD